MTGETCGRLEQNLFPLTFTRKGVGGLTFLPLVDQKGKRGAGHIHPVRKKGWKKEGANGGSTCPHLSNPCGGYSVFFYNVKENRVFPVGGIPLPTTKAQKREGRMKTSWGARASRGGVTCLLGSGATSQGVGHGGEKKN